MVTEVDIKLAISVNGSQGNRVTLQGATEGKQRVRLFFYDVPDLGFPTFCQVRSGQVR